MALSLSGDDEEYDSESEQVRAPAFPYVTRSPVFVCLLARVWKRAFCELNGGFSSG